MIEKGEGDVLKIAVFDEEHEKDLQTEVNTFLKGISDEQLVDIKYTVAAACDPEGGGFIVFPLSFYTENKKPGRNAGLRCSLCFFDAGTSWFLVFLRLFDSFSLAR